MPRFNYYLQAWIGDDGRYVRCGHVDPCTCYGRQHAGENAPTWSLNDDGTLDTVISCDECGDVLRFDTLSLLPEDMSAETHTLAECDAARFAALDDWHDLHVADECGINEELSDNA